LVTHVAHPDAPDSEQKLAGEVGTLTNTFLMNELNFSFNLQLVYAPSAISARGGRFCFLQEFQDTLQLTRLSWASSEIAYIQPTAVTVEDLWTIVEQYGKAAINLLLVHGANGYLVTQFLDNTANHRTNQWAGSVENRSRFGLEVLNAAKEVFGRNFFIKLSPAGGYNDVGYVTRHSF
jgi:2,4-dienoyl-CoA reductase-like NADH-dependent reductase (Old Yellow Enzyme family)